MFKRVLGCGGTYCIIHIMIKGGLHDPNTSERGLQRPLVVTSASFEQNITPYILYFALKLCLKGYWGVGELIVTSI